jgi:hypothetical protein
MPPSNVFFGEVLRYGRMGLLFGHILETATHKKDMTADGIDRANEEQIEKNKQIAS